MERDPALLLDMLLSAKDALQFSAELTWETFQASALHQYAIAKALENIGEAAPKCPTQRRKRILKSREVP
jgi:uncharacterized protein with HEPN domain